MSLSLYTHTVLGKALASILKELEDRIELSKAVNVYIAGGMAMHLYAGVRVTTDVDAEFAARIHIPSDIMVSVTLEDGSQETLYIDTNYSPAFALMHEDYCESAIPVDLGLNYFNVFALSPTDLAVSKISRFAENDQEDIAELVRLKLTTADEIEDRANSAIAGYVGGLPMLKCNIADAVALARGVEAQLKNGFSLN